MIETPWWDERAGFFGEFYFHGDNSTEGHLSSARFLIDERTRAEVNGIIHLLGIKRTNPILDVPCGYGRHSVELTSRGYNVVGVDLNECHLNIAKEKTSAQNISPTFIKCNMLHLHYDHEFDFVINMFYSFGFFESNEENLTVLRNFFTALKPGGKFLMHTDVNIPRIKNGKYKTEETRHLKGGDLLHIREFYNEPTSRVEGTWTIESGDGLITKPYSVRVYDVNEFTDMCIDIGFESCTSYGGWAGEPYSEDSEEIIFVATKTSMR